MSRSIFFRQGVRVVGALVVAIGLHGCSQCSSEPKQAVVEDELPPPVSLEPTPASPETSPDAAPITPETTEE